MLKLNFSPFPTIETERLVLREITRKDADDLLVLRTDVDAMKFIDRPRPKSIDDIHQLVKKIRDGIRNNTAIGWGMTLKTSPKVIGTIGFHRIDLENYRAEIGYMMMPSLWGKGLMSEAIEKVIEYGFDVIKLHSIEANVNPSNNNSIKILKKFKFNKEAYFKENYYFNGKFLDSEIYSLVKST